MAQTNTEGFMPVPMERRTLGAFSLFSIWIACNLVVTTVLTGMQVIPQISLGSALICFVLGSAVGIIPLLFVGLIGQKTGLATMVASRGTFGTKGSLIPTVVNVTLLMAWSWAQAGLGGYALNYLSVAIFGYDNTFLYIALTEVIVIGIALYAIKGVMYYEKVAAVLVIGFMSVAMYKLFSTFSVESIMNIEVINTTGLNQMIVFEIVVAMALSWVPMAADYTRNCRSRKACVWMPFLGYTIGTAIAMSTGAILVASLIVQGGPVVYEPSAAFGLVNLGIPGAAAIFLSVLAANVMCVYSSTMSILNFSSKLKFRPVALFVGIMCLLGALFSGILDVFLEFLHLIGVLFMPMFAIVIADFYVVQKSRYDIEAIVSPELNNRYCYYKGFNIVAITVYVLSAGVSFYMTMFMSTEIGATIPSFFVAFFMYLLADRFFHRRRRVRLGRLDQPAEELATAGDS